MLLDCATCPVRATSACDGCVVAYLLGSPPEPRPAAAAPGARSTPAAGQVRTLRAAPDRA